jgi:hypothetical protein
MKRWLEYFGALFVTGSLGACGSRLVVSDAVSSLPDGGGGAVEDASGGGTADGRVALTPCGTGRLCWSSPLPTGDTYTSVWASADDDVWMTTASGTVVHWDGVTFETKYRLKGDASTAIVWGTDRDNVWAFFGSAQGNPCTGVHWTQGKPSNVDSWTCATPVVIHNVAAASPLASAAWGALVVDAGGVTLTNVLHGKFQVSTLPAPALAQGDAMVDAFAALDGELGEVWGLTSRGHLSVLSIPSADPPNISEWQEVPQAVDVAGGQWLGVGLWGSSRSDVWAVLEEISNTGASVGTVFRHFDGTTWQTTAKLHDPCTGYAPGGRRMWGRSSSDVWLSGYAPKCSASSMWHWDGSVWSKVASGTAGANDITALVGTKAGTLFAVGAAGRLFRAPLLPNGVTWRKLAGGEPDHVITTTCGRCGTRLKVARCSTSTAARGRAFRTQILRVAPALAMLPRSAPTTRGCRAKWTRGPRSLLTGMATRGHDTGRQGRSQACGGHQLTTFGLHSAALCQRLPTPEAWLIGMAARGDAFRRPCVTSAPSAARARTTSGSSASLACQKAAVFGR